MRTASISTALVLAGLGLVLSACATDRTPRASYEQRAEACQRRGHTLVTGEGGQVYCNPNVGRIGSVTRNK
jgi:hypothetical protein